MVFISKYGEKHIYRYTVIEQAGKKGNFWNCKLHLDGYPKCEKWSGNSISKDELDIIKSWKNMSDLEKK